MNSIKIAVISDTHVPDRAPGLDPALLKALSAAKVEVILHAGDISAMRVINELQEIAPVIAARGNRDFMLDPKKVRMVQSFEKFGIKIALMHGQMNFFVYWIDKFQYIFKGYNRERYISRLPRALPDARVYVFGHTHHAENFWQNGKLFFNPGSVTYGDMLTKAKTWGLLQLFEDGSVQARILPCP